MTLQEAMEGLAKVRERMYQDATRLTIELDAYEDVLVGRTRTYDHAWERSIYTDAYNQAVVMQQAERKDPL